MARKLFLQINMTVDGYVEDANGDIDWHFADAEFDSFILDTLRSIDGMVFGRVAFEKLAAYWPTAEASAASETQRETARLMNELPKHVLSHTLTGSDWHNSHVLSRDVPAEIERLKARPGKALALFAGATAATSLVRLGVVDELRLIIDPLLQGGGTRLFDGKGEPTRLELTTTRPFASGAVVLTYVPRRQ
jgi:dihydrofolate reductase